jgi:hypothetical protein
MGQLNPDAVTAETAMKAAARIRAGNSLARRNLDDSDLMQSDGQGGTIEAFNEDGSNAPVPAGVMQSQLASRDPNGAGRRELSGLPEQLATGSPSSGIGEGGAVTSEDLADLPGLTNTRWDTLIGEQAVVAEAWKSEEARIAEILYSLDALGDTLGNFAEDAIAAKKYGGEEGQRVFHEGHRARLQRRGDLIEELAAFDRDGSQPRRELEVMFDEAGISTSGMDDWGPEQIADTIWQASGVAAGGLPHPDAEEPEEWEPLTGGSGADSAAVNNILNLNLQPTESGIPKVAIAHHPNDEPFFDPTFEEFEDMEDYQNFFGSALRWTALIVDPKWENFEDENNPPPQSLWDYENSQVRKNPDEDDWEKARAKTLERIGERIEELSGQDLSTIRSPEWLGKLSAAVYDLAKAPANPRSDPDYQTAVAEMERAWQNTYPFSLSQHLGLSGLTEDEEVG